MWHPRPRGWNVSEEIALSKRSPAGGGWATWSIVALLDAILRRSYDSYQVFPLGRIR